MLPNGAEIRIRLEDGASTLLPRSALFYALCLCLQEVASPTKSIGINPPEWANQNMNKLTQLFIIARQGLHPYETMPDSALRVLARQCGKSEVAQICIRLKMFRAELLMAPAWNGDNLRTGNDNAVGLLKEGYIYTAKFLGFDEKTGRLAYSYMDLFLSAYGMSRLVMKTESWRLFHYIRSDYVRNIKNMTHTDLLTEMGSDAITIKTIHNENKS